jgi:urease accessory protein
MLVGEPIFASWKAELALAFERRGARTVIASRRHEGPLVVQKPFYPEGDAVCHAIVVHPPGGIAGGDELELSATVGERAGALLTTPGAAKWYRSAGPWARQRTCFAVEGVLEWLPQETIVFDGALADLCCEVNLAANGGLIGWEIVRLGRTGSGERFSRGAVRFSTAVSRGGKPLWIERGTIDGGGALLGARVGLGGQPVYGTLYASFPELGAELVAACRGASPEEGQGAVTLLPGLLLVRYVGASSEAARRYFAAIWKLLRPALCAREALDPRIWRT